MSQLVEDCLRIIFTELKYVPNSLYSCILVNRFWCIIGVQILWERPYEFLLNYINFKKVSYYIRHCETLQFIKFYNTIINLLPTSSKRLLIENNVISISSPFLNKPLFNYISFSSEISQKLINDMGLGLIKEINISNEYQEKYKILEQEYYKLFINNCKNITNFRWYTTLPLYQYPGASTCFSQLRTLVIICNQSLISDNLLGMAQICLDIENLELWNCDRDNPGLIKFIENQKNLQSLYLHNSIKSGRKCIQLSEIIEKKAVTLKRFSLENVLLSPKFLPSLINLEQLKLKIENYYYLSEQDVQDWKKYLLIASFPKLQYLKAQYLPPHGVCRLIENSQNIKEIDTSNNFRGEDAVYNIKLFKVIAKNCPNIESLNVNTYLKNLGGIKEIILNCNKLRKLDIYINFEEDDGDDHGHEIICDEVLNYLLNYSSRNFDEFAFSEYWRFSVNNLKNFFEGWRGRKPIKFITHFDRCYYFTQEHVKIVQKYYDEGVIDKNTRFLYGVNDY
ncbi:unnamed protein product [Rhizophagus irregularis]|nr:unnamed protein product [Rhizophagus irregularis]